MYIILAQINVPYPLISFHSLTVSKNRSKEHYHVIFTGSLGEKIERHSTSFTAALQWDTKGAMGQSWYYFPPSPRHVSHSVRNGIFVLKKKSIYSFGSANSCHSQY